MPSTQNMFAIQLAADVHEFYMRSVIYNLSYMFLNEESNVVDIFFDNSNLPEHHFVECAVTCDQLSCMSHGAIANIC